MLQCKGVLITVFFIIPFVIKGQELRVDHVIAVVNDLEHATSKYQLKGFTIKQGRQHANGLHNAHIKFDNNTSYELMTVSNEPNGSVANGYKELLRMKEGGVYICLTGLKTPEVVALIEEHNYKANVIEGRLWNYITVIGERALEPFFFIDYKISMNEDEYFTHHANGCKGIKMICVEGDSVTCNFLKAMGFEQLSANQFKSKNTTIRVVEATHNNRPRLTQIQFITTEELIINY